MNYENAITAKLQAVASNEPNNYTTIKFNRLSGTNIGKFFGYLQYYLAPLYKNILNLTYISPHKQGEFGKMKNLETFIIPYNKA